MTRRRNTGTAVLGFGLALGLLWWAYPPRPSTSTSDEPSEPRTSRRAPPSVRDIPDAVGEPAAGESEDQAQCAELRATSALSLTQRLNECAASFERRNCPVPDPYTPPTELLQRFDDYHRDMRAACPALGDVPAVVVDCAEEPCVGLLHDEYIRDLTACLQQSDTLHVDPDPHIIPLAEGWNILPAGKPHPLDAAASELLELRIAQLRRAVEREGIEAVVGEPLRIGRASHFACVEGSTSLVPEEASCADLAERWGCSEPLLSPTEHAQHTQDARQQLDELVERCPEFDLLDAVLDCDRLPCTLHSAETVDPSVYAEDPGTLGAFQQQVEERTCGIVNLQRATYTSRTTSAGIQLWMSVAVGVGRLDPDVADRLLSVAAR